MSERGKQEDADWIRAMVAKEEESNQQVVDAFTEQMFAAKRVPLSFLSKIPSTRDFHELGYTEVTAAMKPGVRIEPFEHYFDFVVHEIRQLEPLWNEQAPAAVVNG